MNKLPSASVRSLKGALLNWFAVVGKAFTVGLGCAILVGVTFGIGNAGCRNKAITYAKAVWPEASCDALETGCDKGVSDTAICRIGDRRYLCFAGPFSPKCEEIQK